MIAVQLVAQVVEQGCRITEIGMFLVELPQDAQPGPVGGRPILIQIELVGKIQVIQRQCERFAPRDGAQVTFDPVLQRNEGIAGIVKCLELVAEITVFHFDRSRQVSRVIVLETMVGQDRDQRIGRPDSRDQITWFLTGRGGDSRGGGQYGRGGSVLQLGTDSKGSAHPEGKCRRQARS